MDFQSPTYEETLHKLEQMYPNQFLLTINDLAKVTSVKKRTLYKSTGKKSVKKLPIQPVNLNSRLLRFSIFDVAKMLSNS